MSRFAALHSGTVQARTLATLLDMLEGFLRRYVVVSDSQAAVLALWVAHAYALDATDTTPYLHVTSAEPESGKSRLLEVLELVVPRPLTTAGSVTVAVMFRVIHARQPTLLLDEADNVFADKTQKAELLGVVNAGWRRGQRVYRMGGPQHNRLDEFDVFCAKAISGLDKRLARTLASRCLRIEMRRRLPDEQISDFFMDEARTQAEAIAGGLASWAEDAVGALRDARPARLGVRDRLEEGLRLLLAIAQAAGSEWEQRARAALLELSGVSTANTDTYGTELLRDVQQVLADHEELPTDDLLRGLFAIEESPWAAWWADGHSDEAPQPGRAAAMKLARMLKPFGVTSRFVGDRSARRRGYRAADLVDAFARYLPPEVVLVVHTAQPSQKRAVPRSCTAAGVHDLQQAANPHNDTMCTTCTTSNANHGAGAGFWLGRDGVWRCHTCEPPHWPAEVVEGVADWNIATTTPGASLSSATQGGPADPHDERESATAENTVRAMVALGDEMYPVVLARAADNGHITPDEYEHARALNDLVARSREAQ